MNNNAIRAQVAAAALRSDSNALSREPIGQLARDIEPERICWVWPGRLAAGKLTVFDGDPGLGKSTVALEIAARISTGDPLPGGTARTPRGVVLLSAEDGPADTIVPRLIAARADLNRVFILQGVQDVQGVDEVTVPGDLAAVEQTIRDHDAALLVIDPFVAFLGSDTSANKDQDVRRAIAPLVAMLDRIGAACLAVRHLNKASGMAALYRGGGSIGIVGAARVGLLVARDPDDDEAAVIAPIKSNLSKPPPALRYRLQSHPGTDVARVVWDQSPVTFDAAGLLAAAAGNEEDRSALQEAVDWLADLLALGPKAAADVLKDARRDGLSETTVKRAKARLGVQSQREGFGPGSHVVWFLPDRPPYDDPTGSTIESQTPIQTQPITTDPLWENPRNGNENGYTVEAKFAIQGQPRGDDPVCNVDPVWGASRAAHTTPPRTNTVRVPVA
jgi:hypothetical protein